MNKYIKKIVLVSIALIIFFLMGCGAVKKNEESLKSDFQESQEIQEDDSNLEEQEEISEDKQTQNRTTEEKTKLQVKDRLAILLREESIETSYQVYSNTYDYGVDGEINYSVPYFQIFGLNNPGLEDKINEVLLKAAIEWLRDNCLWASDSKLQITSQTEDYFSYIYMIDMNDHIFGTYCYGVTIDLKTGVRLSLDDFLTIDDTFMEQVAAYDYNDEFVFPLSVEESKTMIESALMTELEYLEENGSDVEYVMGPLKYKSSFYIKPGDLIIIRDTYDMGDIYYSKIQME